MRKSIEKIEFGDYQTPKELAKKIVSLLTLKNSYAKIIEPTCGLGSFLEAFIEDDVESSKLIGWEINPSYVEHANKTLQNITGEHNSIVKKKDFFKINWKDVKNKYQNSILFVGNPPWVTNSELSSLLSKNLPKKYNFQNLKGLEAMTGKSNFDISEWMLIKLLEFISGTNSSIAFLIKTSVARKLFQYVAKHKLLVSNFSIKAIDAKKYFNVNVDACLFLANGITLDPAYYTCPLYKKIDSPYPYKKMGIINNKLISDIDIYSNLSSFDSPSEFKWRSGVKHDASKIMELTINQGSIVNGLGEIVDLPLDYLYPMYKSSQISRKTISTPNKYMLITQKKIGDKTKHIEIYSPKTWKYLLQHSLKLDARKSSIYKNNPRFSVFGVGDYTFLPWKIVISGLYKNIIFSKIGCYQDKPIVVDDTCYMLGFEYEEQADFVLNILTSSLCQNFIDSLVFIDNKRPITVSILNRINIKNIAKKLRQYETYKCLFGKIEPQLKLNLII